MKHGRTGGILVKILFYFAVLMLVVGGALVYVARHFDPKDFNLDIQEVLSRYLGRECTINGAMEYSYFPWLGVVAEDVEVAQPESFGKEPFLRVRRLELRIKLMPLLLEHKIILGRIVLEEPSLLLIKNKQGRGNWKDWAFLQNTPPGKQTEPDKDTPFSFESLTSNGVDVLNGQLVWDSRATGNYYDVTGIELRTDAGLRFDFKLYCDYSSRKDESHGSLKIKGEGLARPELQELELRNSDVEFSAHVSYDDTTRNYLFKGYGSMLLLSEVARMESASLKLDEVLLEGSAQGSQVFSDDMALSGKVRVHEVDVNALLGPDPAPAALTLLRKATASADYTLKNDVLTLSKVDADLSGTRVTGQVIFDDHKKTARWTADCATGKLDLDKLFPDAVQSPAPGSAADKTVLPSDTLDTLRGLALDLKLRAKQLIWRKRTMTDAALRLTASKGQANLKARAKNFCQGSLNGSFLASKTKRSLQLALAGVDTAAVLQLLNADSLFSGTGDINLEARFSGNTLGELASTLQADLRSSLTNGSYEAAASATPAVYPDATSTAGNSPGGPVWPFSACNIELAVKAASSDKNVVRPFDVKAKLNYKGLPPWLQARRTDPQAPVTPILNGLPESRLNADVRGRVRFSLADLDVRKIENAQTRVSYKGHSGDGLNYRYLESEGSGRLSYDVLFDTLDLKKGAFSALGFALYGDTHCAGLTGPANKRIFTGNISISAAKPRAALRTFLIELPIPLAPNVYRNWSLRAAYQLDNDALQCDNLRLRLDKSKIKGRIGVYGLSKTGSPPFINFDLIADTLPLDDYRPLEKKHAPGVVPKEKDWDPEQLRKLHLDGKLFASELRLYGLRGTNLRARIAADQGKLQIRSLKSRFYNGDLDGKLTVEAPRQSNKLVFTADCKANSFQLGPMLNALGADNEVTGTASVETRLAGAGRNSKESLTTLGGRVAFAVRDGSVIIKRTAQTARASRGKRKRREPLFNPKKGAKPKNTPTRTSFDSARGVFDISQGVLRNKDFLMRSTLIQALGEGQVNLPREQIDYTITVQMTGAPSIPIHISGRLKDPSVTITHGIITDTAERIGGSLFDVFEGIYTLPFKAYDLLR